MSEIQATQSELNNMASVHAANVQSEHQPVDEPLPENEELEADDDSSYGSSINSETTTLNSSVARGHIEHGRRYQTTREGHGQYFVPSDDKQFESMEVAHLIQLIMESQQENPLFRSPISDKAQNVLDVGCGDGSWAIDVADRFPNLTVRGIDLYPPPVTYLPPNCILEVDDAIKEWTFSVKFDLIHLRLMVGAFTRDQFAKLYLQAYLNTAPGGWIEHIDVSLPIICDDGTMPKDSILANWYDVVGDCAKTAGNHIDIADDMVDLIKAAGFVNIQEKNFKIPIGGWPKHQVYQDAGKCQLKHFKTALEGWVMFLLTRFGQPEPWKPEEVQVYVAKMKSELDQNWHIYQNHRRVWAQKPYDSATTTEPAQPKFENLAAA